MKNLIGKSISICNPYYVTLYGKGKKKRLVPLREQQVRILKEYMEENNLDRLAANQKPLFTNNRGGKLTNAGVTYILSQYAANARVANPELIPETISPHCLRHSKAMHLLQAGVNLVPRLDWVPQEKVQKHLCWNTCMDWAVLAPWA